MVAAASAVSGGDRVALVRHGGGAAAAFARGLKGLADVGLHHQLDVAGDLAAGPGDDGEHGGRVRDAVAMGVPGRVRQRQLEFLRQPFRDRPSLVAERGERAGGAAELQRKRLAAHALRRACATVQGRGIFRELEPERHRQRVLQPGAATTGLAMLPSQSGKARDRAIEIAEQRSIAARRLSIIAVSITSWLVAPQCT